VHVHAMKTASSTGQLALAINSPPNKLTFTVALSTVLAEAMDAYPFLFLPPSSLFWT
jgi:hypothetical protein